jgi:hypothetical protein
MAIQGIIQGFANPADLSKNVVLVGRGPEYVLLVDGKPTASLPDLPDASPAFHAKARELCQPDWRQVQEVHSNNVNANSEVVKVGGLCFADILALDEET